MSRLKVCVCTSNPASAEPRAPRHAVALANMSEAHDIVFLDCIPRGQKKITPKVLDKVENLIHETSYYPHKKSGLASLLIGKLRHFVSRRLFLAFGFLRPSALSVRAFWIEKVLKNIKADVYVGHNIDTLLPIYRVAKETGAMVIFDCMEYYSYMGDSQSPLDREIIRSIESKYLPTCDLVLASSDRLADELAKVYGIKRPLPLYNAPSIKATLPKKGNDRFSLYWRNSNIGLGQRGLGDALAALRLLPVEIILHIQGKLPFDMGRQLRHKIKELGLSERVVIHPPHLPHEAVESAALYTVGLCLERGGIRNHELTVSNKIFDYLMAGLAVVASDLPGLRDVVMRSGGGLLFKSGCPEDLAEKLMNLYTDRKLLARLASQARLFALSEGNLENEMENFKSAFSVLIKSGQLGSSLPMLS